jgi:hypothetical protein
MSTDAVISREYKLMFKPGLFPGDTDAVLAQAARFWDDYVEILGDLMRGVDGSLDRVKHRREIRFFDTEDRLLRCSDYAFRERIDVDKGQREVTLKFRHPDRYIAQGRDLDAANDDDSETKLEEDIKPPFLKLYSYSTKQPIDDELRLENLGVVADLYPGLRHDLDGFDADLALKTVGGFTAREAVIDGGGLIIGKDEGEEAECALVVWHGEDDDQPVVAEFSYKYGDEHERYGKKVAARAYEAFELVQTMDDWRDKESLTKTAYIYSLAD